MQGLRVFAAAIVLAISAGTAFADPLLLAIRTAAVVPSGYGDNQPILRLTLTPESARAFGDFTGANVGRTVELRVDGSLVMAPVVREPIRDGTVDISGSFVPSELRALAGRIATGGALVEVAVKPDE